MAVRSFTSWAVVLAVSCASNVILAQTNTATGRTVPDISGFWERRDDVGGGSFGGILEKIIPKASLRPEIVEENRREASRQQAGDVVSIGSRWCLSNRYPFFMQHSAVWDIIQTPDEIVQVPEVHTFARRIYLDGRKHPGPSDLTPSINGHATGRWEGETLVVDSIGFLPGGATPGGGRIGAATHLVERFSLLEGGKKLRVVFTWDDPAIYLKPHTYEFIYYKSDPGTYALEEYCHADDPVQGGSVVQPKQQ